MLITENFSFYFFAVFHRFEKVKKLRRWPSLIQAKTFTFILGKYNKEGNIHTFHIFNFCLFVILCGFFTMIKRKGMEMVNCAINIQIGSLYLRYNCSSCFYQEWFWIIKNMKQMKIGLLCCINLFVQYLSCRFCRDALFGKSKGVNK